MRVDATVRAAADVIVKTVGDELVLLDFQRGIYYGLDPVGARIWQLLAEGRTIGATIEAMLEEFDVTREQLEGDVERLLGELAERELVVVS